MIDLQIEDSDIKPIAKIPGYEHFDIVKYLNEHIYIFSSKVINAKLELIESYAIQYIYEYYLVLITRLKSKFFSTLSCHTHTRL